MQALILSGLEVKNGLYTDIKNVIEEEIRNMGYKNYWIDLTEKRIDYCTGCGYCADKKPGICVIKDDMQEVFPLMATYELLIFLCPISFGGYNSELKKAVDRYSPLGLPTYTIHRGELHHPARYPFPVSFMSIGILDDKNKQQEETFKLVSERMSISCFSSKSSTVILYEKENKRGILEKLKQGFANMGVHHE